MLININLCLLTCNEEYDSDLDENLLSIKIDRCERSLNWFLICIASIPKMPKKLSLDRNLWASFLIGEIRFIAGEKA
jgi:hypothetical protein